MPDKKKDEPTLTRREIVLAEISAILKEYDGESNVPINHDYWDLKNEYRSLSK